ncbi:nucleotidyltransferase domain-containing protein [Galbitalea soli]|uniref:Nucleotidyltransferase domain-containing protein n=1 Tax=Galbitalea soli TaxID=1268042 RepID=A0A7C9TU71_9MICO|nr:nucleotidyltransferase domain-containing protein [Galbitalea soli]NEM92504.1 nucleotidyltransferase domain-containing protein [Galbitalea soli]NYJ29541.1 hypothetical protein [Galbitalea soli]
MIHHEEAIARYVERVAADDDTLGVVITGSLARGTERADSDVDLYLVVTEERWERAWRDGLLMVTETEGIGYEGGYYDIKLATLSYLDDAADRGDDAVRESFATSRIAFSRVDDLPTRLARAALPAADWDARVASFLAQLRLHGGYFLAQAHASGDRFLLQHAAVHLVLAASRLLLAHNRVLFQGPKYLSTTVHALAEKPDGWEALVAAVLDDPSPATAGALMTALESFRAWPLSEEQTLSTFILDNELAWRYRTKTPEYS